mgnify:CR=1 FL=1
MRLVKLTRWDGVPIHVNPSRILYVEPGNVTGDDDWGSVLVFEQTWHPEVMDGRSLERVLEPPNAVAALFISPLGRDAA